MEAIEQQLFEAAKTGNIDILHQIQDPTIFAIKNLEGDTACHVALQHGHLEFALQIASLHPPILYTRNAAGDTVLHCALKMEKPDFFVQSVNLVRDFLGENIKYTDDDFYGQRVRDLVLEAQRCCYSIWDREGSSLTYLAAANGYLEAVDILMKTPCLGDRIRGPRESTALHAAVLNKHYAIIEVLLRHKPELTEYLDGNGQAPLHLAVILNDCKMIEVLVNGTKDVNIRNRDGFTPIHLAVMSNLPEIFESLIQLRPECLSAPTEDGQNVLHLAVKEKVKPVVEFIVKDKKWSENLINQQDKDGNTPLHIAADRDDEKMLKILLGSQTKVLPLKNKENLTFGDISRAHKERKLKKKKEEEQSRLLKAMDDFHSSLLVMATLITTVTFTAAFTMPGGYKNDREDQGTAILLAKASFKVFLVSDTISMCSSIIATAGLIIFSVIYSTKKRISVLKATIGSIGISLLFMLVAFAAGVWAVIGSGCHWLAILIVVATLCTPVFLALVYGPIMLTSEKEDEN